MTATPLPRPPRRLSASLLAVASALLAAACAATRAPVEPVAAPTPVAPTPAPATRNPAVVVGPDGLVLQTQPTDPVQTQDLPPPPG